MTESDTKPFFPGTVLLADTSHSMSAESARLRELVAQAFAYADIDGDWPGSGGAPNTVIEWPVPEDTEGEGQAQRPLYGDVDGVSFAVAMERVPLKDIAEFYAKHQRRLIALVRKVLQDYWFGASIDPADIVQDAMVVAVREWPRIGRMKDPGKYLRKVAARLTARAVRTSSREVSVPDDDFLTLLDGTERSLVEELREEDLLLDVIKGLPRRQAQVLLLTADGWSDSQIGLKLGLTAATVRSHRRHARNFLAEDLGWQHLL